MAFFDDCKSIEELEARKKLWAKRLHPDAGGVHATFTSMMQEYHDRVRHAEERSATDEDNGNPSTKSSSQGRGFKETITKSAPNPTLTDILDAVYIGATILTEVLHTAKLLSGEIVLKPQRTKSRRAANRIHRDNQARC